VKAMGHSNSWDGTVSPAHDAILASPATPGGTCGAECRIRTQLLRHFCARIDSQPRPTDRPYLGHFRQRNGEVVYVAEYFDPPPSLRFRGLKGWRGPREAE